MTMMMNTVTQSAAAAARSPDTAQPVQAAAAQGAGAQPGAAQAGAQAGEAAQPFAAWLGNQAQAAALAVQAGLPVEGAGQDAAAPAPDADATKDGASEDSAAALPQDGALLAAMAMPLMPLTPVQVAQAVQAAQPTGVQSGEESPAAGNDAGRRATAPDRGLALLQAADAGAAPAARPAASQADAVPAIRIAAHAQADAAFRQSGANTGAQDGAQDGGEQAGNGNAGSPDRAAIAGAAAAQPAANAPSADTVKLAGPPTAWRQSLQEALGERLNVQVGKNMEQAVIRLEPPQLGRIDIAIRHSAGSLEVTITATNTEVLRQLQTVSDNLRNDLSQRQFSEVAVTVAPAPKNGAAPFGDPQQGRGRQQEREQEDKQPGHALAEASNNASVFSLGGRD
jgi:flagellar hook-length control protein FliK